VITAKTVAQDAASEYKSTLDQVIRAAIDAKGKFTLDPNTIATLRALEYELLGHARLGALKKAELPALIFAEGKPRLVEEILGRVPSKRRTRKRELPMAEVILSAPCSTVLRVRSEQKAGILETDGLIAPVLSLFPHPS
jgi:hypothetical protein